MMKADQVNDTSFGSIKSPQEAEFAVRGSIAVREQYKSQLRSLLSIINSHAWPVRTSAGQQLNIKSKTKQKKTRCTDLKLPEVPAGKEIHVLGDLLLLVRAASVNVVENIQAWRRIVHQGLPRPYMHENENYLLMMCEDFDFLDQVEDLVEWLGFRLLRNSFIVMEAMDDIMNSRLGVNVQNDRSLKYWRSASWRQNKLCAGCQNIPELSAAKSTQCAKANWKKQFPPQPLVKPLESIQPEDDVVDGSRIAAAQEILLEEEGFHGRLLSLRVAQEYADRGPSKFECGDATAAIASHSTVHDAIAVLNSQQKKLEYQAFLLQRERTQVNRTLQDLRNQAIWTELRRDCDSIKNHRIWQCQNKYRQEALEAYAGLSERLQSCLATLDGEESQFCAALGTIKTQLSQLRLERDKQRASIHAKEQQEKEARRAGIREKTAERGHIFRAKPNRIRKCNEGKTLGHSPKFSKMSDSKNYLDITADIKSDLHLLNTKNTSSLRSDSEDPDIVNNRLEEKRERSICLKRARLGEQARIVHENELGLDRRRAENVSMKKEDTLSRVVETAIERRAHLQFQKARMNRLEACAMFKCTHSMNGKIFLLSVYSRNARGYDRECLHIVAYDPGSSTAFTLEMAIREFNSLGYGRTNQGMKAFCNCLCLLYERRRRQFRLVWSGSPCPPPLRVRESDQTLLCVHKEGVRTQCYANGYSLVAVYVRTDEPSTVKFVVSSWSGDENFLTEHIVFARGLILDGDLDFRQTSGHVSIVWKHGLAASKPSNELRQPLVDTSVPLNSVIGPRVYSGEVVVDNVKQAAHIYDTNETEYTMELIPKRERMKKHPTKSSQCPPVVSKLFLAKREVNPYGVHLPPSSFTELLTLINFEKRQDVASGGDSSSDSDPHVDWKASISTKWATKLANYVRVLRLAKYACKLSGVYCFVAIFFVQLKSEFRAHLLLEITRLSPTLSNSFSRGGVATRQSLQIALSDYLHCSDASRRLMTGLDSTKNEAFCESKHQPSCLACLAYSDSRADFDDHLHPAPDTSFNGLTRCSTCATIQFWRLQAIKDLIIHAGAIAPSSLEIVCDGYCNACAAKAPPIMLVIGLTFSPRRWLVSLLKHYFVSFDCSAFVSLHLTESDTGATSFEASLVGRQNVLHALNEHQVVVLFNANCGVTVSSANAFAHELHWWLYPDHEELPCHIACIVGDSHQLGADGADGKSTEVQRDYDVLEAIHALDQSACQIAELPPIDLSIGVGKETDHASAFDSYLVAEAMIVEATRALLHPEVKWEMPRKIVGASSWSSACSYLLDPIRLSADLRRCNPLSLQATTTEILEAYFSHSSWPRDYPNVRPVFYGLLNFMMHMGYVLRILCANGGALQESLPQHHIADGDSAIDRATLSANISVISYFQRGSPVDSLEPSHS